MDMAYHPPHYNHKAAATVQADMERSCISSGQQWKRFSVFFSIMLAALALVTGAISALNTFDDPATHKALIILNVILNSAALTLSAMTSLDWQSRAAQEAKFVDQLLTFVNVHHDGKLSLGRRKRSA